MRWFQKMSLAAGLFFLTASAIFSQSSMTGEPTSLQVHHFGIKVYNTNVPGRCPATDGKVIAFYTDEGMAGQDLNGDTFITPGMYVIQYWDFRRGLLVNTQEEGMYPSVSDGVIAFTRWEQNGGAAFKMDWNGDGDTVDWLIAYYDIPTQTTIDTLADGLYPDIDGDIIAFYTNESSVGPLPGTVLNGDGDTGDPVIRYWTISTGILTNAGCAGNDPSISGNTIVFATWETYCPGEVPNPDFNGDGDLWDNILRYHQIVPGVTWATTRDCWTPTIHGTSVAFGYDENDDDGAQDADGDMDAMDRVLQLFDVNTWVWCRPMFPITSIPTIHGRYVAFSLEEFYLGYSVAPAQGTELNGNGFNWDHIVCLFDTKTGAFTSTGVAGFADSGDCLAYNTIVYQDMYTGLVGYIKF